MTSGLAEVAAQESYCDTVRILKFMQQSLSLLRSAATVQGLTALILLGFLISPAVGQENPGVPWPAADGLGRTLPLADEVGLPRHDRFVGVFYFLTHGRHGDRGPFDISKILAQDPTALTNPSSPLWGPVFANHHWGQPRFDYYVSEDESVLRKHAQMLADAGVDVIVFDVSNQLTYPESWQPLCRVFEQVRQAGGRTPQIAFLCPFGDPHKVVQELWAQLYRPGLYSDLWFRWQGKPLILADPELIAADTDPRTFFTFRKPQPDYFTGPTGPNQWGWLEVSPQHVFTNAAGVREEMTVGTAQNAVDGKLSCLSNPRAHGRSFQAGEEPPADRRDFTGRNFAEQWRTALAADPEFIFITGWNEWTAMRFDHTSPFYGSGAVNFVDQFDEEFSRDIEPMQGGHGDAYYYQMIANIRRYKGVPAIPQVRSQPIKLDGRFEDWMRVEPEFSDTPDDPVHRSSRGYGKGTHYDNQTGRNDLLAAKVSLDGTNVYFYIRTRAPLTSSSDSNWMLLFIDVDQNPKTGWLGYDFVVNRVNVRAQTTTIECNLGGYHWGRPREIPYRKAGNELELAIPRGLLALTNLPAALDFKWADNIQQTGEASDLTVNGDAAPNDRFNFRAKFPKAMTANEGAASTRADLTNSRN